MNDPKPHIVIDKQRNVIVPDELKEVAVQYDHNILTLIFDCPRYWDGYDLSKSDLCINYVRSDGVKGARKAENLAVDTDDDSLIHFSWRIANHLTSDDGPIKFQVCSTDGDDIHWSSRICKDLIVLPGMQCPEIIQEEEEVYE